MALSLKELVQLCIEHKSLLPESSHHFIEDMEHRIEKFKDKAFASPRQMKYLSTMIGGHVPKPEVEEKPKSRIQELREKRDKLISASRKRAMREVDAEYKTFAAAARLAAGEIRVADEVTAQAVHARTGKQLRRRDKLAVRYTKR